MRGTLRNILFAVFLFFPSLSSTEEDRFFWSAEFVSKPNNFYHGAPTQIPAIEGDELNIECKVRAVSEDTYTIIWDYEDFNAVTSGETVLVNNTAGDEYAVDTIKVNITTIPFPLTLPLAIGLPAARCIPPIHTFPPSQQSSST